MNLSPKDVEDILAVLDSTDYDELHLATERFVLTLRREGGGWTQEHTLLGDTPLVRALQVAEPSGGEAAEPSGGEAAEPSGGEAAAPPTSGDATSGDATSGDARGAAASAEEGAERCRTEPGEPLHAVTAQLPGVFYRAPKPGAAPYIEVGDHVATESVVAILETMKLMNAVHAGADGTVVEICLDNAAPAEQGAVLMWLRADEAR